jgi:hypothetical protein
LTVDEELNLLEEGVRRLKVEYDVFFGGGSKKPPADTEWRVQRLVKKFSDGTGMNFAQRFRYNTIVQRYAIYTDLWRQKLKVKEEGYRRPQDALLAIQGLRPEHEQTQPLQGQEQGRVGQFSVRFSDGDGEQERVRALYDAMIAAKKKAGEATGGGSFESFQAFVRQKTEQIRKQHGCKAVEYSLEVQNGQVRLKAKPKS